MVNVILLAAGNVMDPSSILLIMAPILFPLATKLGIHPVHLGVLMIVNTEVGLCHPPVGLNLYIASGIAKMGISEITIAVLPWLCAMLIFLGLITYIPGDFAVAAAAARHDLEAFNRLNADVVKSCSGFAEHGHKRQQNYILVTEGTLAKL